MLFQIDIKHKELPLSFVVCLRVMLFQIDIKLCPSYTSSGLMFESNVILDRYKTSGKSLSLNSLFESNVILDRYKTKD